LRASSEGTELVVADDVALELETTSEVDLASAAESVSVGVTIEEDEASTDEVEPIAAVDIADVDVAATELEEDTIADVGEASAAETGTEEVETRELLVGTAAESLEVTAEAGTTSAAETEAIIEVV
jgi:hypothetical protein